MHAAVVARRGGGGATARTDGRKGDKGNRINEPLAKPFLFAQRKKREAKEVSTTAELKAFLSFFLSLLQTPALPTFPLSFVSLHVSPGKETCYLFALSLFAFYSSLSLPA